VKLHTILTVSFLILLPTSAITSSSTGEIRIEFQPKHELRYFKPSPRSVPAKLTTESKDALERNGYVHFAWIVVTQVLTTCWGDKCKTSFKCDNLSTHEDFTAEIIAKAPGYGGDLVVLTADKTPRLQLHEGVKLGKCTYRDKGQWIGGSGGFWQPGSCREWETVHGQDCAIYSAGEIWRLDKEHEVETHRQQLASIKEQWTRNQEKYIALEGAYKAEFQRTVAERVDRNAGPGPFAMKVGGKYGFADKNEKEKNRRIVIEPQFTDCVIPYFSEGLQAVAIGEGEKQLWGYIDRTGNWVIRPSYKEAGQFYDGLADVRVNDKKGYIDKQGNFVIKAQFDTTWEFIDGIAKVKVGGRIGYVNKAGEILIQPEELE
jgi:hypothetical protein